VTVEPFVIVGNGVAAINAAEAIRARGDRRPIIILSEQECAFYSRPCLYYIMLGRIEWEDAWGRPEGFYRESGIDLRCGTTVTAVDPIAHTVEMAGQEMLGYSRLLLATGTRGRALPWSQQPLRGTVTLNTLSDVLRMTELLAEGGRAVIVGGGLTSIELVEVCRRWGLATTFIMRGDRFLDNQLTAEEADLVHARLRASGVEVMTNEEIAEVRGDRGRVAAAITKSGRELPCEIVGCAAGVVPNAELAQAAGAQTERGIVVDDHMRSALTDVYAAGDVARVRQADGSAAPAEMLWYAAAHMGRVAGANMAGGDESYRPRVFLNVSEFCGLDFCGVGQITPGQPDVEEVVVRQRDGQGNIRLVMRDGVLIGACFLGDIRLSDLACGLIARGARVRDLGSDHPIRSLAANRPV
jgi:NAD(P)H-nitrite reductase large subunit